MASTTTKKYQKYYWLLLATSWLLTLGPLLGYGFYAFIVAEPVQKIAMGSMFFAAVALTGISIVCKLHLRSTLFILLLGVYIALREITILLVIVAVCTILDELIVTPLKNKYKSKLNINKEIDKRIPQDG